MNHPHIVIAIDGPAASGKSSVAKGVAEALQIPYINTGNMYRALTAYAHRAQIPITPENETRIFECVSKVQLAYEKNAEGNYQLILEGTPCGDEIRTPKVTHDVSILAAMPTIRQLLVEKQRRIAEQTPLVMEGRDIGTVVFPNAKYKFFLTASPRVRAERRLAQSNEIATGATVDSVAAEIAQRDKMDENRAVSPLKKADDAILVDSSSLSLAESIQQLLLSIHP